MGCNLSKPHETIACHAITDALAKESMTKTPLLSKEIESPIPLYRLQNDKRSTDSAPTSCIENGNVNKVPTEKYEKTNDSLYHPKPGKIIVLQGSQINITHKDLSSHIQNLQDVTIVNALLSRNERFSMHHGNCTKECETSLES
jgi:hypothetical protein